MKKYASLFLLALFLNGCDDGDLTVDTIDFDSVTPVSCVDFNENSTSNDPTIIYKLKSQEALILQLPKTEGLVNDPGEVLYDIDENQYRVLYRAYNGTVAKDNICGTIPPSTPNVTEEWTGTAGKIRITTAQVTTDPDEDGATRIKAYNHTIRFENITFLKPSGPQIEELFEYGTYQTNVTPADLTFADVDTGKAFKCADNKKVYNYNASFTLTVENLDANLLSNVPTLAGQPKTANIGTTNNKVVYRTFASGSGSITSSYDFCAAQLPSLPLLSQTWVGASDTAAGTQATIEVTTESVGGIIIHTVVLKNVVLTKGGSSFKLGNSFLLGKITVE